MQKGPRAQPAQIYPCAVDVDHVDVKIIDGSWTHFREGVEGMAGPLIVLLLQVEAPDKSFLVQIESEQAVETG